MGESVKTILAVVVADAGVSNAAERHGFDKEMNVYLIDRAPAEGQACEKMIDRFLVAAEQKPRQRFWALLHLTNRRIDVFVSEDRQKRPKDFVLHDRVIPCHGIKDCRIEIARLRVGCTTCDDFLLIDEAGEALNRSWADDARVVGIVLRIGSVQLDHGPLAFGNKVLDDRFVNVSVSGRRTPLAAPGQRAPYNFLGRVGKIGGRINECRILSAEFEENGGQVLGSGLHDDLAHLYAAGEEDEVKRKFEKFRNFVFASRDGGNGPRVEVFRNEIEQELTGGGQTLGEFEDAWISCRKNLDRRVEKQGQRAVEG